MNTSPATCRVDLGEGRSVASSSLHEGLRCLCALLACRALEG
jgi:hypothetical protein